MQIKWHRKARQDLRNVRAYIAGDKPEAAAKVARSILQAVERLPANPLIRRPGRIMDTRDLINRMKKSTDPNYCVRVSANDGALGEQHLRTFQDNEKSIPTILATSQKFSTGIDARNVRTIVLMRPVNSMIEFKQIIGRGTRLFDGKGYFTIYDFVKA